MKLTWRSPFTFAGAMWRAFTWLCRGRPIIAPEDVRLDREQECQYCEHRVADQCLICSCLIDAKVLLSSEECPDDPPRWKRLTFRKKQPNANDTSNG